MIGMTCYNAASQLGGDQIIRQKKFRKTKPVGAPESTLKR